MLVPLAFAECPRLPLDSRARPAPPRPSFIARRVSLGRAANAGPRKRSLIRLRPGARSGRVYVFCIRRSSPAMHLMHRLPRAALPSPFPSVNACSAPIGLGSFPTPPGWFLRRGFLLSAARVTAGNCRSVARDNAMGNGEPVFDERISKKRTVAAALEWKFTVAGSATDFSLIHVGARGKLRGPLNTYRRNGFIIAFQSVSHN